MAPSSSVRVSVTPVAMSVISVWLRQVGRHGNQPNGFNRIQVQRLLQMQPADFSTPLNSQQPQLGQDDRSLLLQHIGLRALALLPKGLNPAELLLLGVQVFFLNPNQPLVHIHL